MTSDNSGTAVGEYILPAIVALLGFIVGLRILRRRVVRRVMPVLGLEHVIGSLHSGLPSGRNYRGAALRSEKPWGWRVVLMFIDEKDSPIKGAPIRTLDAVELDGELIEMFGGKDLLVLE